MEFDIRTNQSGESTVLRFSDDSDYYHTASGIVRGFSGVVEVIDLETDRGLRVRSEEHAQNLIKALNKAIALGWFKE